MKLLMTISRQHPHCLNQYFKVSVVEDKRYGNHCGGVLLEYS